jgi:hypothetical protein
LKIHDAARRGDIAGVAGELASGVEVDSLEITSGQSALQCVCALPEAPLDMIRFLVGQGAQISAEVFQAAVQFGSLETIRYLLQAGARVDAREEGGCGTLALAAYGRASPGDTSLLPVFAFLIDQGAGVNIVSSYNESALRIVSHRARFDAVRFLLEHQADPAPLEWTDLMVAVALGTLEEVQALLAQGADLSARDCWQRTPWLLSLHVGDLSKARLLLAAGAERNDRGQCQMPPLQYAVEGNHIPLLEWLLAEGFDVNAADESGATPLFVAAEHGYAECVALLLQAGADPARGATYAAPIERARTVQVARLLLAAGEDLSRTSDPVWRELTGMLPGDPRATPAQYRAGRGRQFGTANPERMDKPFWQAMIQSRCNAYQARLTFADTGRFDEPVWCYQRFGRTTTLLPDGRLVEVAGEHEDFYDPDFCIYNDVVVFDGRGHCEIFGYPEAVFPPTDFHSATPVGDGLYLIGSLGYLQQRRPDHTPVFRLDCRTFAMERIQTIGDSPGWICHHTAWYEPAAHRLCVRGGEIYRHDLVPNSGSYALDLKTHTWVRLS